MTKACRIWQGGGGGSGTFFAILICALFSIQQTAHSAHKRQQDCKQTSSTTSQDADTADCEQEAPISFSSTSLGPIYYGPVARSLRGRQLEELVQQQVFQVPKSFYEATSQAHNFGALPQPMQANEPGQQESLQPVLLHSANFDPFAPVAKTLADEGTQVIAGHQSGQLGDVQRARRPQQISSPREQIWASFELAAKPNYTMQLARQKQLSGAKQLLVEQLPPLASAYKVPVVASLAKKQPKVGVDLTQLLQPGEVLLAEKETQNQGGKSRSQGQVSQVSVKEIEELLARLRPLALSAEQQVSSLQQVGRPAELAHVPSGAEPLSVEDSDEPELDPEVEDEREEPQTNEQRKRAQFQEDELAKSLAELGAHLAAEARTSQESLPEATSRRILQPPIPIELLVDHLMSGSRLATRRGSPSARDREPVAESVGADYTRPLEEASGMNFGYSDDGDSDEADGEEGGGEDEDDEETPYEDQANELEPQDSMRSDTRSPKPDLISFDVVANKSDSWVPLAAVSGISRASPSERNATQKKIKKVRKKKGDDGIMIGSKKLSRAELIQLIRALNKLASKREPSKQREASRKLLRLLIRLALDKFKRQQQAAKALEEKAATSLEEAAFSEEDVARLKKSLRSLLVEPQLLGSTENQGKLSIRLQALRAKPLVEQEAKQDQQIGGEAKRKSLADISDDLEQYFDTDFFEDLADKVVNSSDTQTMANERRPQQTEEPKIALDSKRMEQADEEDVELDHVRMPIRKRLSVERRPLKKINRNSEQENEDEDEMGHQEEGTKRKRKRKRIARKRIKNKQRDGIGKNAAESKRSKTEAIETIGRNGHDHDDGGHVHQRPEDEREEHDNEGAEERVRIKRKRKKERRKSPAIVAQNEANREEEDKDEPDENDQIQNQNDKSTEEAKQQQSRAVKKSKNEREKTRRHLARKRKKKRKRRQQRAGKRPNNGQLERNEIPAPILAEKASQVAKIEGKPKVEQRVKSQQNRIAQTNRNKTEANKRDKKMAAIELKTTEEKKKKIQNKIVVADNKESSKKTVGDKKTAKKRRESDTFRRLRGAPLPSEQPLDNNDYDYGQGTTYSEYCGDDGNCSVTMKSSNPKLTKAIEQKDDSLLVRQLDKWIKEDADRRIDVPTNNTTDSSAKALPALSSLIVRR